MPLHGHQPVERESFSTTVRRPCDEQVENARQAGEMSRQQDLSFVTDESVTNPFGRIRRLQTSIAMNSAEGLHALLNASAVWRARSFPLCQMTSGRTPRAAASAARRAACARPPAREGR